MKLLVIRLFGLDAGLDFVDVDSEVQVKLDACLCMRLDCVRVSPLIVALGVKFLLKFFITQRLWQVMVAQPGVDTAADLFHRQPSGVVFVEFLANAAAQQETQTGDIIVSMDASPAANFEVIQTEFLFAEAKLGFDDPASEGDSQQTAKSDPVLSHDSVGDKEFGLTCADAASGDQCVPIARESVIRLTPDGQMFDFPDFRALVRVFDAIHLPRLFIELSGVIQQVADFAGLRAASESRRLFRTSHAFVFLMQDDVWFCRPDTRIHGDFRDERLISFLQSIQKFTVPPIEFVARPVRHADTVAERSIHHVDGDLRLGLKRHLVRDEVFFRRAVSSIQSCGKYRRLSSSV